MLTSTPRHVKRLIISLHISKTFSEGNQSITFTVKNGVKFKTCRDFDNPIRMLYLFQFRVKVCFQLCLTMSPGRVITFSVKNGVKFKTCHDLNHPIRVLYLFQFRVISLLPTLFDNVTRSQSYKASTIIN